MLSPKVARLWKVFEANRAQWMREGRDGQFVVVNDSGAVAFCETERLTFVEARAILGERGDWIVQEIVEKDRVYSFLGVAG